MHEKCGLCRRGMQSDPRRPGKHIDPETGIWPIAEWGASCGRGLESGNPKAPASEALPKPQVSVAVEGYTDLEWGPSRSGNLYARTEDGYVLVVSAKDKVGGRRIWRWVILSKDDAVAKSRIECNNEAEAKHKAWDVLEGIRKR